MTDTITLGGREFRLKPLTLGELRPLLDALDAASGAVGGTMIEAAARVLHAGLAAANPGLVVDDLLALEATVPELNRAVAAVLQAAGLVAAGEAAPVAGN